MIVYRGTVSKPPPALLEKYPDLASYPAVEVAPLRSGSNGRRQVDLLRVVPGIAGFRENRVACTLDEVSSSLYLLTATAELSPGRYALSAGTSPFEFEVE